MPSRLNQILLNEFSGRFNDVPHGILVDYTGLSVNEASDLRVRLMKSALRMTVIKNRIAKLVFQEVLGDGIGGLLSGPIAIIYGNDDPVAAAKTVIDCIKEAGKMELRGGFVQGKSISVDEVESLSKMPSKEDLLAHILSGIEAPASNIAYCLDAVFSELNIGAIAVELSGLFTAYHEKLKSDS